MYIDRYRPSARPTVVPPAARTLLHQLAAARDIAHQSGDRVRNRWNLLPLEPSRGGPDEVDLKRRVEFREVRAIVTTAGLAPRKGCFQRRPRGESGRLQV